MIQLNLLPDVKLEYIRAQKMRSLVTSISIIVTSIAVVILVIVLIIGFAQKHTINNLKSTIATETSELKNKPDINNILTVQNQLTSLKTLYSERPAIARLFSTYLGEVTPETASLNQLTINFAGDTATLTGSANSIVTINKYVDTLKLTTYSLDKSKATTPAFTNVVLTSFGLNSQAQNPNQAASFTINLNFASAIFNISHNVNLTVPNIIVTHSEQSDPGSLFSNPPPGSSTNTSTGGH